MLLIGVGAGMPWAIMDDLDVNVVPKYRAGMGTGIFNTARVAGEGVTLAIVSVMLAAQFLRTLGIPQTALTSPPVSLQTEVIRVLIHFRPP